ncbi:hypothetical protein JCM13210_14470 [Thermaerobacter litoralis]
MLHRPDTPRIEPAGARGIPCEAGKRRALVQLPVLSRHVHPVWAAGSWGGASVESQGKATVAPAAITRTEDHAVGGASQRAVGGGRGVPGGSGRGGASVDREGRKGCGQGRAPPTGKGPAPRRGGAQGPAGWRGGWG